MQRKVLRAVFMATVLGGLAQGVTAIEKPDKGDSLFIENVGQFDPNVRFYAPQTGLWIRTDGLWVAYANSRQKKRAVEQKKRKGIYAPYEGVVKPKHRSVNIQPQYARIVFPGARVSPEPFCRASERVRFYCGPDQSKWCEDVPVWHGVRLIEIYPGVDLELMGSAGTITWRWVCEDACPEFNPVIQGRDKPLRDIPRPEKAAVPFLPPLPEKPTAKAGSEVLLSGTFVGGSDNDAVSAVAVDHEGRVYIAGSTGSTDPGFTGATFVASYDRDLKTRRFITFLGGELVFDRTHDLFLDGSGNLYLTGTTYSPNFPVTPGAFDETLNDGRDETCPTGWTHLPCPDAYAAKFNSDGQLLYATYLGGAEMIPPDSENIGGDDYGIGIRVDAAGHLYVVGKTDSDDFPTTSGAFDRTFSSVDIGLNPDVFVVKLQPEGQGAKDLIYGTYVGSGSVNEPKGMALDGNGVVHVTGGVRGDSRINPKYAPKIDFPHTPGAYPTPSQCLAGKCAEVFFFKLNPAGGGDNDLIYGTFFGGSASASVYYEQEYGSDVALFPGGSVLLTGVTESSDFPVSSGAYETTFPSDAETAAFAVRLNPDGQGEADLRYGSFLGGSGETTGKAIAARSAEMVVVGETSSPNFPVTKGAFDSTPNGGNDGFLVQLDPQGRDKDDLIYGTYLGGSKSDAPNAVAVGPLGLVSVAGDTASADFPIPLDAHQATLQGGWDGFVAQLAAGAMDVYVNKDEVCDGKRPCFPTIQQALTAAGDGACIYVGAGTYNETLELDISKSILISGSWNTTWTDQTPGATKIHAPATLQGTICLKELIVIP